MPNGNVEYHPLNPSQNGLLTLFSFYPDMTILNLAMRMDFLEEINEERLLEAVRETGRRLPYLNVRFCEKDDETVSYLSDEPIECEVVDLSDKTPEEVQATMESWNKGAFRAPILDKPLFFFRLVHLADGKRSLFLCGQHFIVDGYSLLYTADYFTRVYEALDTGKELPAPAPTPWKSIDDDWAYYKSERYTRDMERSMQRFETEPQFTSINGLGSPEFIEGKRYGKELGLDQLNGLIAYRRIPKELAARVDAAAKASNLNPSDFYLLALRVYLGHVSGTDDVTTLSSITARRTSYEQSCGFNLVTSNFVRTIIPETASFIEGAQITTDALAAIFRRPKMLSVKMRAAINERFDTPAGCIYASVMFAYLSVFDLEKRYMKLKANAVGNGQTNHPLYMVVVPENEKGDLMASYVYSPTYTRLEAVEKFHAFMLRFLDLGLANPDKAIGELVEESL